MIRTTCLIALVLALPKPTRAQNPVDAPAGYTPAECPSCAEWNAPQAAVRLHGNTYYVGTRGLAALLVTSRAGHVLLDGGLPESAPLIAANIRALGFQLSDVRLIVNSHAHYDHAGGIAALQRASGARVAASPRSAPVLSSGLTGPDDPQHRIALAFPAAQRVQVIEDGDTLRVGDIALIAHFTPGHTPGGTSWSWRSCDGAKCLQFVYADSQTPVSAAGFSFTRSAAYPEAIADFHRGFAVLESLRCDVLVTPHPGASSLWARVAARDRSKGASLRDPAACRRYAASAREALERRIVRERAGQ